MKTLIAIALSFAIGLGLMWSGMNICLSGSQEEESPLINNPSKLSNPKAGRTIGLREVFRITDEAGDFVFLSPSRIQVIEDGAIFLGDQGNHLGRGIVHMFWNGKFVKDLVRIGQGPGEFPVGVTSFFAAGDSIVLNKYPNKFVWCDSNGNQVREVPVAVRIHNILAYLPPYLIGVSPLTAGVDRKSGIKTIYYSLRAIDEKGTITPIPVTLFTKDFIQYPSRGGVISSSITEILSAYRPPDEVYISHTIEYLISVFDCAKRRIVLRFKRDYKPVKRKMEGSYRGFPDVENDVQKLFVHQDEIWVLTSTERDRHPLIDVFDQQGKYVDAFYFPMDVRDLKNNYGLWNAMTIFKDSFYVIQEDEKGNLALVKYLVED